MRKKSFVETLLKAGYPREIIAEAVLETYQTTGELPADSFLSSPRIHTIKGGGWFLFWDKPDRRSIAPYIKEITL